MPHTGKGVRLQYNRENLESAVAAVSEGMSVRKAAASFQVPRSTLHDRVTGRVGLTVTPGKQTVFPAHIEKALAEKVKNAAAMGFGINRRELKVKAARIAATLKLATPFKDGIPGDDWVNSFLKRYDITLRSQVPLATVRSRMLNPVVVRKYFEDLGKQLTEVGVYQHPQRIWNMDETSVSLTHKPTRVLAEKGSRNVPGRVGNSREAITVLACVNAAGSDVPPMVVVRGKTKKSLNAFNVSEGPHGTQWTFQSKGWMEDSLGTEWFNHVFLPNIGPDRPQILILDSHSSHESLDIIESAVLNNIVMITLPPHTTQWLNPLDKTVFGPFSREYDRSCTTFMASSPNNLVCKWNWPGLFKIAYEKTVTKYNITKGFATCGIFPYNPEAIPSTAFKPSEPFDRATVPSTSASDSLYNPLIATPTACPTATPTTCPAASHTSCPAATPTTFPAATPTTCPAAPPTTHPTALPTSCPAATPTTFPAATPTTCPAAPPIPQPSSTNANADENSSYQVLGTADSTGTLVLEAVSPGELVEALASGGADISNFLTSPTSSQGEAIVAEMFTLPTAKVAATTVTKKRKLTSHRILTSDQILNEKREAKVKKEQELEAKEARKCARQLKMKNKQSSIIKKKSD